jgi:hypothetical protein
MCRARVFSVLPMFQDVVTSFHRIYPILGVRPHKLIFNLLLNQWDLLDKISLGWTEHLINDG